MEFLIEKSGVGIARKGVQMGTRRSFSNECMSGCGRTDDWEGDLRIGWVASTREGYSGRKIWITL